MHTFVHPHPELMTRLRDMDQKAPIDMLNMLRFRDRAEYADDSEFSQRGWSGAEAYAEYGRRIRNIGGPPQRTIAYQGGPQLTLIGPETEQWDAIFVVRWNSVADFLELINDPDYAKESSHRTAAVADSRLVALMPAD